MIHRGWGNGPKTGRMAVKASLYAHLKKKGTTRCLMLFCVFFFIFFFALPRERGTLIATQSEVQHTQAPRDTDTDAGGIGLKPEFELLLKLEFLDEALEK